MMRCLMPLWYCITGTAELDDLCEAGEQEVMNIADGFTVVFTLAGLFFFFSGTLGLMRFPDVFSRLHALTKADSLGLGLIVLGLLPQVASLFDALQLILTWVFVMISGAVSSYLVANFGLRHFAESPACEHFASATQNSGGNNEC